MLALLLRGNHFEGHIPSHLCQMQHLQYLDLSGNRFSGHIPTCLSNVSLWKSQKEVGSNPLASDDPSGSLEYGLKLTVRSIGIEFTIKSTSRIYHGAPLFWMTMIDLSSNQLDGTIPSEIGELRQLRSLNLSHNLLGGHLPVSLCNLESLESLDLSHNNKLNGTIPHEMVQLNSLSTFSVAFNNLSGMIPFDRQFSTFTEDKYEGNPGLCGPPLKRNCSSNDAEQSHEAEEKEDEEKPGIVDSDVFFYSCVAMSFVLGFWSYIALLFFNKKWRVRIFKVVDKYSDLCFKR